MNSAFLTSRAALLTLAALTLPTIQAQQVFDGGSTVSVPADQASPWNTGGNLTVGNTGSGTLSIVSGGVVTSTNGFLGYGAGSTGTVNVSGANSTWQLNPPSGTVGTDGLYVGYSGSGFLTIADGGKVQVTNSSFYIGYNLTGGTAGVTVTGANSNLSVSAALTVGRGGAGSLTVSNGGTVNNATALIGQAIDPLNPGIGTVLVTGTDSKWTANTFNVLTSGSSVTITDGGKIQTGSSSLSAGDLIIRDSGSAFTVTGALTTTGGSLKISDGGELSVGGNFRLSSDLLVESGGKLTTTATGTSAIYVGYASNANANAIISGTGSEWNSTSANLIVSRTGSSGNPDTSALTIRDGGKVTVGGGTGTVTLGGGNYSVGNLNIGDGGLAGTLNAAEVTAGSTSTLRLAQVNFNHTGTTTFAANMTGVRLGVNQMGTGTTVLTGTSTYSLATAVTAGTLINNGNLGSTAVSITTGGSFGGYGVHTGSSTFASGATVTPGYGGAGNFTTGAATFEGGAAYLWELTDAAGAAGQGWDLLTATGTISLLSTDENPFLLTLAKAGTLTNFDSATNHEFVIASAASGISGFDESAIAIDATGISESSSGAWSVSLSSDSRSLVLSYSAVPEASTLALAALGLGVLARRRRH